MTKFKLEYIWPDGSIPIPKLRSKTKVWEAESFPKVEELPLWNFDGSSTGQADKDNSHCLLKPITAYPDGARHNGVLVLCEVLLPDGTPHPSNSRSIVPEKPDAWFGFEQEYFFMQDGRPLGFPKDGYPAPQGDYYAGVGHKYIGSVAREIVEEHMDLCLEAGICHEGLNAEVAKGQWEFQIFGKGSRRAADDIWVARYLLSRLAESYEIDIDWRSKPVSGNWNGSGMHTNFSTEYLRETGGKEYFESLMDAFAKYFEEHIAAYGPDNHLRLTGMHETSSIDFFSYGIGDRSCSLRVPTDFVKNGYRGYLEDRRPSSYSDPYAIVARILRTIQEVPEPK